jgi:hypothetical protein
VAGSIFQIGKGFVKNRLAARVAVFLAKAFENPATGVTLPARPHVRKNSAEMLRFSYFTKKRDV